MDWVLLWGGLLVFIVFMYVALDGFDLGIGVISIVFPKTQDKQQLMQSIAPIWDGNETWLVLGGGALLAGFPLAYAIILPAIYPLLIVMLLALVFRGVAFEYTHRTHTKQHWWYFAFFMGSLAASVAQGMILGTLLQGIVTDGQAYQGGWWDWLTPFTLFCGLALTVSYGLLGCTWAMIKLPADIERRCQRLAKAFALVFVASIFIVSAWLPFKQPWIWQRWFRLSEALNLLFYMIPILSVLFVFLLWRQLANHRGLAAYLCTLTLFFLAFCGFCISLYPYLVPYTLTLWQTASPINSLRFLFVGVALLMPMILAYSAYGYWVFRGKIHPPTFKTKSPK